MPNERATSGAASAPGASAAAAKISTVDGLRGLAALLVVFDHTVGDVHVLGAWAEQNHGITLFALLSGFLLSSRFLRSRLDRLPRPSARRFMRDRVARIYPGYWLALAIAALTIGLHQMGPGDGWQVITLTQTYGTDTAFKGLPPTWSLSLFLSFYLALPLWSWWRGRGDRDRSQRQILRREIAWLAGLIPLALFVRATEATAAVSPDPVFTIFGRADWFAIGMILAAVVIGTSRDLLPRWTLSPGRRPWMAFGGALALTMASAVIPGHLEELRDQLDTGAAALLIAGALLHGQRLNAPQRLLASRPARALGRWSYGIFLWGYIAGKAIGQIDPGISTVPHLVLSIAAAIVLGAASWRFVEQPAARWLKERRGREPRERRSRQVHERQPRGALSGPMPGELEAVSASTR